MEATREVLVNDSSLNIHKGRVAAWKALAIYVTEGVPALNEPYVPDISPDDQRLDDLAMTSYNTIRNSWIAMYEHWKYPDLFVVVQSANGAIYTQVNQHVYRMSDTSQATLW